MNIDYKAAGKMMGSYRRKEKISQKELAKAVGISNNYLSNIENGYTIPSLETFTELSVTLGKTPTFSCSDTSEKILSEISKIL